MSTPLDRARVLQFLPTFAIGGTERHVTNLIAGLDRARFDLHFGFMRRGGEFMHEIVARKLPISEYPIRRLYGMRTLRQQVRLASDLRRNRIDIVHSYNFYANCFAIPAARLARTPVIVASIRDTGAFLTPYQRRAQRVACRLATVVLVNAEAVRRWLIGQGYDAGKIVVIRNGIDVARFDRRRRAAHVRHELGVPAEAPLIAMLGRITPLKGLEYFLEAAASVAAVFPEARFLVVGDTPNSSTYRSELEEFTRQLGLQGRVAFTGFRLDVAELLSEVTVSVLPSLSEGLSNTVLESMAAGVPVVATPTGGTAEAIEDGVTGLLVPTRNSGALARAVVRLLEDRALAARLGRAARERVAEQFSLEDMVRETEQFYAALLGQARTARARRPALVSPPARMRLRRSVKSAAASLFCHTGGDRLVGSLSRARTRPLVLGYHRVVEDFASSARVSMPQMLVSRRMLEAHLDWVGRRYRFITFDELLAHHVSGEPFDQPVAAVSFDDGYVDVYEQALPLLRRKGIPAAVFLVTDLVGTPRLQVYDQLYLLLARVARGPQATAVEVVRDLTALGLRVPNDLAAQVGTDPFAAVRRLLSSLAYDPLRRMIEALETCIPLEEVDLQPFRSVTWEMVAAMQRAGFTMGSHTKRHSLLTNETADVVNEELAGSRCVLEGRLGAPVRYFAYPDGRFNSAVVSTAAAAGYQLAVTTCWHRDATHPLLTVPRRLLWEHSSVDVTLRFSPPILDCYLNGVFDLRRRCVPDHHGSLAVVATL